MAKFTFIISALLSINATDAFSAPAGSQAFLKSNAASKFSLRSHNDEIKSTFDPLHLAEESDISTADNSLNYKVAMASTLVALTVNPAVSNAAGPDWGLFEGRTGSLLHPIMMAGMFLFSLSTGLLGFQIRRTREIGQEISDKKKYLPKFEGSSLTTAISTAEATESPDASLIKLLKDALPVQAEIDELTKERKELVAAGPRDKHFGQGVLLAFLGTSFAIEGPLNTYARAGKLFPGPHLYAGASLVVLWSLAAACVPAMQKGNDTARSIHIGANALGMGLFGWQVVSGWPILLKVIEKTQWP